MPVVVAEVSVPPEAFNVYGPPALFKVRPVNVATPALALSVLAPPRVAPPGLDASARLTLPP